MRKLFTAAVMAVAMLPSAFMSHALASHFEAVGGCNATLAEDAVAGQGQMTGTMDVEMLVYSSASPTSNPVSATVTCYITVNGMAQLGATITASGTFVLTGGGVITITSSSQTDDIQLCTTITFMGADGSNETVNYCSDDVTRFDTGIVCAFLAQFAGTHVGSLWIDWDGDVWYGGFRIIDCPPRDDRS